MAKLQEIHDILMRVTFPSTKEEIIDQVVRQGVSQDVVEHLQTLPEHFYGSVDTVLDTLRDLA